MHFKTILTVVTDMQAAKAQIATAANIARAADAHLEILCVGVDRVQPGYYFEGASAIVVRESIERAQQEAETTLAEVNALMAGDDIRWSSEAAVAQFGGLGSIVALRARFADLVVQRKPYGDGQGVEAEAAVEAAIFDAGTPVLVVPSEGLTPGGGRLARKVVLAWNQGQEALNAARAALPVLKAADLVNIVVIDPPPHGPERSDPGGALSQWLARHGVKTEVSVLARTMPRISDILARHCADVSADLLVMGAYGHSRFREAILGGATRNTLEQSKIPVLMAR